jgi:hypothetical protein
MKLELDRVCVAEAGDYFQVTFDTDESDGPYLLLQRQFEDADGGYCYVETHDEDYIGHSRVNRALLEQNRFVMELRRREAARIEVTFNATEQDFEELRRILRIMIPHLKVRMDQTG